MNRNQKAKFKEFVTQNHISIKQGTFLKTGENRSSDAKEGNYLEIQDYLQGLNFNTRESDIQEAVGILKEVLGREVEIQKPPADGRAAQKLQMLVSESSGVTLMQHGISVRLDNDQLKHQHKDHPIGTRVKGGGNRFVSGCDGTWHQQNTLSHMATWAGGLANMQEGEKLYHGQAVPVGGIHYEGYCLMAKGSKYVLFHCYPANDSALLWGS